MINQLTIKEDTMSAQGHLEHLQQKHKELDTVIQDSYLHHLPDEVLRKKKLEKLHLKEEIEFLKRKLAA